MNGYVCIAMLEDPPYNLIVDTTENDPEDWCGELPLPSHLLCFQGFKNPKSVLKQLIKQLNGDGVEAKTGKAFSALPHKVIRAFIKIRDDARNNNQVINDINDADYEEGKRLRNLAWEYQVGSKNIIPDLKKAFKLYLQSAELGNSSAYLSLTYAYFDGDGTKKDLNESLKWAMRSIESSCVYGYAAAADCFVGAEMKDQASDMWRRCFQEQTIEEIQDVLGIYARHASEGLVEHVHSKEIARLFGAVAENETNRKVYIWLWENQIN